MEKIIVYTDGGCRGNNDSSNNVGGYGVVLQYKGRTKEIYKGERNTTNNQQELKGVIVALESIKTTHLPIVIHSDSAYVINGITQWVKGWKKNGWTKKGGEIKNLDLWKRLDELVNMQSDVTFVKVKAHVGIELNELVDTLANKAMDELETEE